MSTFTNVSQPIEITPVELSGSSEVTMNHLAELLCDCVESGASVGFTRPFSEQDAMAYWHSVELDIAQGGRCLLLATSSEKVLGAVQLSLCDKPNGLHRGEVEKLMVHTEARGLGVATSLMKDIERIAVSLSRCLIILDTKKGDIAEGLYVKLGYIKAGEIPGFALSANGELDATVLFYKYSQCKTLV